MENKPDEALMRLQQKSSEEIDENSLEYARRFKPKLRFDVGDTVYLKSDIKRKCPMTIYYVNWDKDNGYDYYLNWISSQKEVKSIEVPDKTLMP